ncbi:uncharacterized protein LOC124881473 isoform X3 [Girardinichthys multiradiatus]|uniref:uncharacterized protein LOC124881473 isoform X3 n=1 Tax=Girardinichthys multiradiatus TaxID=208333 RepID=UPI001FABC9E4|nr:uncharacterized protein LOC124881473 isoform X3 [Girardinichthys multiradiatus]
MRATVLSVWLLLMICSCFMRETRAGAQLKGFLSAGLVQSECRDRYLWIRVASAQVPHFEAVDEDGVHSISKQLASRCGYTISTFRVDGVTIFRASYYACFTHNQNDEVFTFKFNVMVKDGSGDKLSSQFVSAVCSGLSWTHRELTCEEDYMEVNVNRESSCGGQGVEGGQVWQEALFKAQRTASLSWQLMFLQSDGQTTSMSIPEAQRWGYSMMATSQRVILRSPFKQPYAEVTMVDDVPVETVRVSLFFKQKLVLMIIDMSMACTLNSGSFDGTLLLWEVPQVLPDLVGERAEFESRSFSLGLEGFLLDEATATSRGLSLVHQEGMVKIGVPFGSEGGFRKSLVVENMYKEFYMVPLMYEHVFSLVFDDGHIIDTKHRTFKVLETPLICRPPFSLNKTISDHQEFTVYLGNIPTNVILEEIWINGQRLLMLGKPQQGLSISPIVHVNGSQAYELQLPFNDPVVQWTNVGGGVVLYSIDLNFTLTVVPQRQSYYHQNFITAQVFNAFPPEITAQCLEGGISFSIVKQSPSLWEVGIDHEPLTEQLVDQRGYRLHNDSHRTILEVPVFSVGYTYEDINLSNFYAMFKLLLRDSKTLEVQASASKRCLFRTEDMIVCSAGGTVTVVATPTSTWPMVKPEKTSLLDHSCKPKQTDGASVLFEFKVDSCGTRAMVGEWYIVYENEILHDRLLIADGPNFISREPQFKVTVRCFYPLSAVNRVSLDRTFTSVTPGFGSMRAFESQRDSMKKQCPYQHSETTNAPSNKPHLTQSTVGTLPLSGFRPQPRPGKSHFITVPGGQNKVQSSSNQDDSSETPTMFYQLPDAEHLDAPVKNFKGEAWGTPGPSEKYITLGSFDRIPNAPARENVGSSSQTLVSLNKFPKGDDTGLPWGQSIIGQSDIGQHPSHQSLPVDLSSSMAGLKQPTLNLYGSSGVEMAVNELQNPVYQHRYHYKPNQAPHLHTFLQPQGHVRNELPQPSKQKVLDPGDGKSAIPDQSDSLQEFLYNKQTTVPIQEVQNLEGLGPVKWNIQSRVQSIRVKPPSKFVSSVLRLNQKPIVQQTNSQSPNLSKYVFAMTPASGDENHRSYQQTTENRGSKPVEKHLPERPDALTPMQVEHQHPLVPQFSSQPEHQHPLVPQFSSQPEHQHPLVPQFSSQPEHQHPLVPQFSSQPEHQHPLVPQFSSQPEHQHPLVPQFSSQPEHQHPLVPQFSSQPEHQHPLVPQFSSQPEHQHPLVPQFSSQPEHQLIPLWAGTNDPRMESRLSQRPVLQKSEPSLIRVRPTGLGMRLQTQNQSELLQNQDHLLKEGVSRMFYQNFTPQNPSQGDTGAQSPPTGEAEVGHPQTNPNGSDSKPMMHSTLTCGAESGLYGTSVHQGIIRGVHL